MEILLKPLMQKYASRNLKCENGGETAIEVGLSLLEWFLSGGFCVFKFWCLFTKVNEYLIFENKIPFS